MPSIRPGQQRARRTSRYERLRDVARGVPRTLGELRQSLLMLGMYRDVGWQLSVRTGLPVGPGGEAVPWFSYPALQWLDAVVTGDERVFEYGTGNSTLWFSERASSVVTVEHDAAWILQQRPRIAANVTLLSRVCGGNEDWAPNGDPYVCAIDDLGDGQFDIVVVDGMARNSCIAAAPRQLTEHGIIIVDNGDRPAHYPGIQTLHEAGFGRVDFVGPSVVQGEFSCTSVFSRHAPRGLAANSGHPRFWGY